MVSIGSDNIQITITIDIANGYPSCIVGMKANGDPIS